MRRGMKPSESCFLLCAALMLWPAKVAGEPVPNFEPIIFLERSVCYGTCPSYTVKVDGMGNVVYQGKEFVEKKGFQFDTVPVATTRKLFQALSALKFSELPENISESCPNGRVTDNPSVTITLESDGKTHKVTDYHGCRGNRDLEKLRLIEKQIDEELGTARWVRGPVEAAASPK